MLLLLAGCNLFIVPTDGTYSAEVVDLESEPSCDDPWGLTLDGLRNVNATDVVVADDGESMVLDGTIDCDLFGLDFNCLLLEEEAVARADATFQNRVVIDGVWTSSYRFESDWEIVLACVGADCGDLSEDCVVTWTFDGELAG